MQWDKLKIGETFRVVAALASGMAVLKSWISIFAQHLER
jgi:hypothetical protein